MCLRDGESLHFNVKVKHKNDGWIWCEVNTTNYLSDPYIKGIVYSFRDITDQERVKERIKHIAYYDHLTGLNNRRSFEKRLQEELVKAKSVFSSFAVILMDIDGFKYVNDTFGHDMGDKLLKEVSLHIRSAFSEKVFCGRLGGDEFVLIFPDLENKKEIDQLGSKLNKLFDDVPFKIDDFEFNITVSIGISVFPSSGNSSDQLMKCADTALYRSKFEGKNQYQIYSPMMNVNSLKMFTLKNDLKKAIVNEEFLVYFQPRINPKTFEITGAEALIRWKHPKWGIVSPNEFISLAEETGLITNLGEWLIKQVCKQIMGWKGRKLNFKKISINISSLQLFQIDFVDKILAIIKEQNINPQWLEFEITESVIIDREEQVLRTLSELKNVGISIALDDFGTGYSSLNYLRKIPCDIVKIDKSFISDIEVNKETFDILEATINLCKKLNKSVVIEGIETTHQLSIIQKLNCQEFQGYLCSKPLEEDQYIKFLQKGEWMSRGTEGQVQCPSGLVIKVTQ
uniref:GGDEF domain-containing protein n=1 Tax=Anaerobacillus isosaccharinicus TaxID=1532552 RepID=A0A1S2L676_9BACI